MNSIKHMGLYYNFLAYKIACNMFRTHTNNIYIYKEKLMYLWINEYMGWGSPYPFL